jgi:CHASE3 domain sensor protein
MMKKFILGVLIGILALAAFLYFGGPKYLKIFGAKTEEAGERLEKYEKGFKHTADEAAETVKETAQTVKEKAGAAKESVEKTVEKTKKAVNKTTEKAKEYAP